MVKILNCYLYAKKSYGTLSKSVIFFGQPCTLQLINLCKKLFKEFKSSVSYWP